MDETRHLMTNFIKKNLCDYEYEFKSKNHIRLLESNETIFMIIMSCSFRVRAGYYYPRRLKVLMLASKQDALL